MGKMKNMDNSELVKWAMNEGAARIAVRVKGDQAVEGWCYSDTQTIIVVEDDGGVAAVRPEDAESVWFLGRWMDPITFIRAQ